jgi:hypothetical protein
VALMPGFADLNDLLWILDQVPVARAAVGVIQIVQDEQAPRLAGERTWATAYV